MLPKFKGSRIVYDVIGNLLLLSLLLLLLLLLLVKPLFLKGESVIDEALNNLSSKSSKKVIEEKDKQK
jgi:hypothetical protein